MELRQLQYFMTLAEELNFSRAADKLCITQGTLSQQIRQFENEIDSELFERNSRNVRLTGNGVELYSYVKRTLAAAHDCKQVALDLKNGIAGTLNIGVTHSFKYLLRSTIKDFIRQYPGIKFKIWYSTATDLLAMLRDRQIDLFVAFKAPIDFKDIETIPLFDSQLRVIMRRGHPLSERKILTYNDLKTQQIALPASGLQSRKHIEHLIDLGSGDLNVSLETNDPNILLEIVSATNLLAITSSLAISYRDDIIAVPLEGLERQMTGCIYRLQGTYVKRSAELFAKILLDSAELEKISQKFLL